MTTGRSRRHIRRARFLHTYDCLVPQKKSVDEEGNWIVHEVFPGVTTGDQIPIPGLHLIYDRMIGNGGESSIVRCRYTVNSYPNALVIPAGGKSALSNLEHRVRLLQRVRHEGVSRQIKSGYHKAMSYLMTDFVPGIPAHDAADHYRLSIRERLRLLKRVCSAVSVLHAASIVHCDLKPDNILVIPNRRPRLIDFGAALEIGNLVPANHPGTAQYKAPERTLGCNASQAIDIYSIGILMYELLVGHHPYSRYADTHPHILDSVSNAMQMSDPELLSDILHHAPHTLASRCKYRQTWPDRLKKIVSGRLDAIAFQAVAKSPGCRYRTVDELKSDIASYLRRKSKF